MKEIILTSVREGISLRELSLLTGKSQRQVGAMLRVLISEGYQFNKTVSDAGDINIRLGTGLKDEVLNVNYSGNKVRVGVISDIHLGRDDDGADNLVKAIDYFKENNIHLVFIVGDLLEGMTYFESSKYPDGNSQLERFFRVFPYNPDIVYVYIKGNHDYSILKNSGLDIGMKILSRPEFIDLGFGYGRIRLGKSFIGLKHDLLLTKKSKYCEDDVVLKGHSHRFESLSNVLVVPALLSSNFYDDSLSSGFLDITFNMSNDEYIKSMDIRQLAFYDGIKLATNITTPIKIKKKI